MSLNFKKFKKIRGTSAITHRLSEILALHTCSCSDFIGHNYFHERFFPRIGAIPYFFSSFSANNHSHASDSAPEIREQRVRSDNIDDSKRFYDRTAETVSKESLLSSDYNSNSWGGENCDFDGFDESDEEVAEGKSEEGSDDDEFRVLSAFDGNRARIEASRRIEVDEGDLRHPLVREICRLIDRRAAWSPKLESELKRLLRSLKPSQVCAVLRAQSDERIALNFFYWADRQWRYRHYPVVYHEMLRILSKTKLCQGAKRVLHLMIRRKIALWPEDFGCVMVSFSRAGHLSKALQVLNAMQRAGVELDISVCNTAVNVLVEGEKLEKALRFSKRMQVVGIEPNVVTYNCLVKGYCERKQLDDAVKLIDEMPLRGCAPDKVSYYTVMGVLCKEKRIDELKGLMKKMLEESGLQPDQVTYNTLIHMLCKHGHGDEALGFLREAEERGFRIDKVGHTAVVHCFCQEGRIDRAKGIIDEMLLKGCSPDVVTYTAVLNGFCRLGKVDQAKKLLQEMYKHGCKPNCVSYTALLNGLCRGGSSSEAREMMDMSEGWWTPNSVTYSVILHGFRREGKLSEACDVVMEMIGKGFYPSPVDIDLLIQSLCRVDRAEQARKLMEECLKRGCAVNVVNYTSVIHGFCQNDDLDSALSVFDDMYLNNKHPDAVTYTAVVDALGRRGRIDEAIEMIKNMLHRGLLPTPVTYRSLIHNFCQQGRVDDLLKLMDKLLPRQSFKTAYNLIIEKLCCFGHTDEAYKILGRILKTASKTDVDTCHILMRTFLKNENPLGSYQVASRMFNRNLVPDLKLCEEVSKKLISQQKLEEADKLMLRFVERGHFPAKSKHALHS
uniref:Pentatricopeptide repeat protein n=1 Tax=Salvia miltiorrhiza TaxID=226208 RepID=A0A678WGN4_SALMI|nr:pentatricopeptide repeat protein [Salvia miltiorrhiza]